MRRSQKPKRVTWASDVKLCQVKLFMAEESPSQVGTGNQDHLQAKALRPVQAGGAWPDDNLPPGFEVIQPANLWRVKLSQIPLMKWKCPPRFKINTEWQVVAGEESKEMEAENQREMRVFEAIYPRPSAIPPDPSVSVGVEDSSSNDQNTPIVPVTPIEDEEAAMDPSLSSFTANTNLAISQPQQLSHATFPSQSSASTNPHVNGISARAVEPDILAAAQAALTSVLTNSTQGGLIDQNLLIKILSDPKMVEQLVSSHGASSNVQNGPSSSRQNMPSSSFQSMPVLGAQTATSSGLQNMPASGVTNVTQNMPSPSTQYTPNLRSPPKNLFDPVNRRDQFSAQITRPESIGPPMAPATGPFYPPQIRGGSSPSLGPSPPIVTSAPSSSVGVSMTKDINYYKSLIQQHGGERRDPLPQFAHRNSQPMGTSQEPVNLIKSRDQKPKIMKPCIYFNSSKGCRNGNNCAYLHDTSSQQRVGGIPDVQSAKRVKLDREIT
ncbi:hypothetical protein CDL12_22274 [Handroanthus impetiginosus]|uniref:C3H1-type domain-containing protein n=1 Tax=Handroanthus impetiginosus TaxID=429701 RepID=A0A2G9GJ09_9LAMI|nr:hypothetical protein CDL12_22274 [Handroanthus impetiginosus]